MWKVAITKGADMTIDDAGILFFAKNGNTEVLSHEFVDKQIALNKYNEIGYKVKEICDRLNPKLPESWHIMYGEGVR
jgi:hypothetical protein